MKSYLILLFLLSSIVPSYAAEGHQHDEKEQTVIGADYAKEMAIGVDTAGPGVVHQVVSLTGKITLNKNRMAQIRARFPGIVRKVHVNIGDHVTKNQVLAIVESNESLQEYPVKSPLDGVVLGRNTNVGDTAETEAMFVVADVKQLWAEFFIFSRDVHAVQPGQIIRIKSLTDDTETESQLTNLLPTAESSSQTVIARVDVNNSEDKWRPGMTVRGDVILSERQVPIAVKTSAIQRKGDGHVVYVRYGDTYTLRTVETGQSDRDWTEIISGLQPGETYVSQNSFIVKADIAKSEAEHAH